MKKLFALALLSLAVTGWLTTPANAWWPFSCCGTKCCTTICLRQYNAFTPICTGKLSCDGCCPINLACGQLGSGPAIFNAGPGCVGGACYAGSAYNLGQLPPAALMSQPLPAPTAGGVAPTYTIPPNNPLPAPAVPMGTTSQMAPQMMPFAAPVQPVGYRPMYYPVQGTAPWYWNNGGR
jgi:hypothetical protein